jgi:hypothetical protein
MMGRKVNRRKMKFSLTRMRRLRMRRRMRISMIAMSLGQFAWEKWKIHQMTKQIPW